MNFNYILFYVLEDYIKYCYHWKCVCIHSNLLEGIDMELNPGSELVDYLSMKNKWWRLKKEVRK